MNDWEKVKLGNVCYITSGGTPSRKKATYFQGSIPWVKTKELLNEFIFDTEEHISENAIKESSAKLLPENTVLLAMYGATVGALGIMKKEMACNQACCAFLPSDSIHYRFLYYLLLNHNSEIKNHSVGSAQQNLSGEIIKNLEFVIPNDIQEQKAIAGVLGSLDDKIEANRKENETLEAMAQALFKSWFIDFEPFGGTMPNDWEEKPLAGFISFIKGKTPHEIIDKQESDAYQPYLTIDALAADKIKYASIKNMVIATRNDILMLMDGASSGDIYWSNKPGVVSSTFAKIDIAHSSLAPLIYRTLKYYQSNIKNHTTGTTIPHTDKGYVLSLKFILPTNVQDIITTFSSLQNKIVANDEQSQTLAQIRDSLLPRLMSGTLRVQEAQEIIKEVL